MIYVTSAKFGTQKLYFCQKYFSELMQWSSGYAFVSNILQESVKNADTKASLSSDRLPVSVASKNDNGSSRGKGLWKFNCSLIDHWNEFFFEYIK